MSERMTWAQICQRQELLGLWVALDNCRYDQDTLQPVEGEVVDHDADLSALCARMRDADRCSCAVRFCEQSESIVPVPTRGESSSPGAELPSP